MCKEKLQVGQQEEEPQGTKHNAYIVVRALSRAKPGTSTSSKCKSVCIYRVPVIQNSTSTTISMRPTSSGSCKIGRQNRQKCKRA